MKKITTGDRTKDEIVQCIVQLAERCKELDYNPLCTILYAAAGSCFDKSEIELASIMGEYARMRLLIREEIEYEKSKQEQQDKEDKEL